MSRDEKVGLLITLALLAVFIVLVWLVHSYGGTSASVDRTRTKELFHIDPHPSDTGAVGQSLDTYFVPHYTPGPNYGLFQFLCECGTNLKGTFIKPYYIFSCKCGIIHTNADVNNVREYYSLVDFRSP